MKSSTVARILFLGAGIFSLVAFIILVRRQKGSLKKAIPALIFSAIEMLLGCYFQWGFDLTVNAMNNLVPSKNLEGFPDEEHIHKSSLTRNENVIEASCTESGSYDLVTYCECGEEISRETVFVELLGHDYKPTVTNPSCIDSGFTTCTCIRCGNSYVGDYKDALGHNYEDGVCARCGYIDLNYVKVYDGKEIMETLSTAVVSDSGWYKSYIGSESISVFAEDQYNCFSIDTAVSYNMWNNNVQNVIFNISNLNEIDILNFDIGGETGSSGSMKVEIFIDKTLDESADYVYELEASGIPIHASIDIKAAISLGIRVTNRSNRENKIVFFNFTDGTSAG